MCVCGGGAETYAIQIARDTERIYQDPRSSRVQKRTQLDTLLTVCSEVVWGANLDSEKPNHVGDTS